MNSTAIPPRTDTCSKCGKPFVHDWDKCRCYDDSMSNYPKMNDDFAQPVACYDCLKTRGFGITISLVTLCVVLTAGLATGYLVLPTISSSLAIFLLFWIVLVGLAGMFTPSYIAGRCIKDYCNTSDPDNYKATGNIVIFGICAAFALVVTVLAVTTIQSNYEWVVVNCRMGGC